MVSVRQGCLICREGLGLSSGSGSVFVICREGLCGELKGFSEVCIYGCLLSVDRLSDVLECACKKVLAVEWACKAV